MIEGEPPVSERRSFQVRPSYDRSAGQSMQTLKVMPPCHLTSKVRSQYDGVCEREAPDGKIGRQVAAEIENSLSSICWPVGSIFGSEASLADSLGASRRAIRQAFRLLETREVCRLIRGPTGGLVVSLPSVKYAAQSLTSQLRWAGVTLDQVWDARETIEPILAEIAAVASQNQPGAFAAAGFQWAAMLDPAASLAFHCVESFAGSMDASQSTDAQKAVIDCIIAGDGRRARATAAQSLAERRSRWGYDQDKVRTDQTLFCDVNLTAGSLASATCLRLLNRLEKDGRIRGDRIGSVQDICDDHSVSVTVAVEALRLLEDLGIVHAQRGRGGGLFLQGPSIGSVVTRAHSFLAGSRAKPVECERWIGALGRWTDDEAIARRPQWLRQAAAQTISIAETAPLEMANVAWYKFNRSAALAANNLVLRFLSATYKGYMTRRYSGAYSAIGLQLNFGTVEIARSVAVAVMSGEMESRIAYQDIVLEYARLTATADHPAAKARTDAAFTPTVFQGSRVWQK